MDEQLPLFGDLRPPKPKPRLAIPCTKARYTRVRLKGRVLCDDCCADIHARGMAVAPPPMAVRWRRTDATGSTSLCERHKRERQANE